MPASLSLPRPGLPLQPGSQGPQGRSGLAQGEGAPVYRPLEGGLAAIPWVSVSAQPPVRQPDGRFSRERKT